MKKDVRTGVIYMFENKYNHKKYIGQTIRPLDVRVKRHLDDALLGSELPFHRALYKYGVDGFDISVLEDAVEVENLDDREIYYISKYDTTNREKGYNVFGGGGGARRKSKYTDEQIYAVKSLLKETKLTYVEISKKVGVSKDFVHDINRGHVHYTPEYSIPIRERKELKRLTDKDVDKIIKLLSLKCFNYTDIAKIMDVKTSTVRRINIGEYHYRPHLNYPILDLSYREVEKNKFVFSDDVVRQIMNDLKTSLTFDEISQKYGISIPYLRNINIGNYRSDLWDGDFPIKDKVENNFHFLSEEQLFNIVTLLKNTNLSFSEIGRRVGTSHNTVIKINNGSVNWIKNKGFNFPIRKV